MKTNSIRFYIILLLLFLGISEKSFCQISLGLTAGGGMNYISVNKDIHENSEFWPSLTYRSGIYGELSKASFGLLIGTEFMTREIRSVFAKPDFVPGADYKIMSKSAKNYLSVPLLIGYYFAKNFVVRAGIENNIFLNERIISYHNFTSEYYENPLSNNYSLDPKIVFEYYTVQKLKLLFSAQTDYLDSYQITDLYSGDNLLYSNISLYFSISYDLYEFRKAKNN